MLIVRDQHCEWLRAIEAGRSERESPITADSPKPGLRGQERWFQRAGRSGHRNLLELRREPLLHVPRAGSGKAGEAHKRSPSILEDWQELLSRRVVLSSVVPVGQPEIGA